MYLAVFYFLGIAVFVLAALLCLTTGKRAGQRVEVDLAALRAASICLSAGRRTEDSSVATRGKEPTWDEKAKWREMKAMWMQWYSRCQEKAILKRKMLYSWARTLALCSVLCLGGVLLETEFDEHISVSRILAGFHHHSVAAGAENKGIGNL